MEDTLFDSIGDDWDWEISEEDFYASLCDDNETCGIILEDDESD